jgi:hypothetical protein
MTWKEGALPALSWSDYGKSPRTVIGIANAQISTELHPKKRLEKVSILK